MNENTRFAVIFLGLFASLAFSAVQFKECNMATDELEPMMIVACEKACVSGNHRFRSYAVHSGCVCD